MTRRSFIVGVLLVLAVGAALRVVWLKSDPPTTPAVGIVWHDEGAWVHNARNKALWGVWRTDNWNPIFVAPVFTGLEYGAFRVLGVGTWQARTVPVASGLVAIAFLIAGLNAASGRRAALLGGALLATNYVSTMWSRAALMESTMTSFIVISWAAYAIAQRRTAWGVVSGVAAVLAFFTKASAAFFVGALLIEAVTAAGPATRDSRRTAALGTITGLLVAGGALAVLFVWPHWSEYHFYNWQMSVERKPAYTLQAFTTRTSWLPLVHDFFLWMWPVFAVACVAIIRIVADWRGAPPARRLLVLWVLVGLLELVVHDSGNERRYVMFMPALIALATDLLASRDAAIVRVNRWSARILAATAALGLGYLLAGSALRGAFLEEARAGHLHSMVVWSVEAGGICSATVFLWWSRVGRWLAGRPVPLLAGVIAAGLTMAVDVGHDAEWARTRQDLNYRASVEVGRLLPAGTLVQGKLANGLALENQIHPIFIGHGFGNYDDRLQRDDVRYILTYVSPTVGYESQAHSGMIQDILDRYPRHSTVATFAVNETGGPDRAALIDKAPGK